MKILFFIESLRSGGKERRLVELIKGLKQYRDIEMELVLTREDIHYNNIFETGINIHYIVRRGLKKDPRLFLAFYKIAKKYEPDIIHVWGNMVAFYAIPSKLLLRVPMINNQITDAPLKFKHSLLSHNFTFPFSDLIIANSHAGLKAYGVNKLKKSKVIYNGFDVKRISQLDSTFSIKEKFSINTKYIIGMVASFSGKKDYASYVRAGLLVMKKNKNVTFLCVGSGDDSIYKKMVSIEYRDNFKFLGRQAKVESIMSICDIGVLSTYTEGISNSIMEFMSLGVPVIATDGGGTKELLIDNETGYLVPMRAPEVLSNRILNLLNNENKRIHFGKMSKKRINENFDIDSMVNSFNEIYNFF